MTSSAIGAAVSAFGAALLATACMSGSEPAAQTTSPAPAASTRSEPRALPPSDFAAEAGAFQVVLSWSSPPEEVESYAIFRDGFLLAGAVPASETTFTDATVAPGKEYTYEIAARGAEGAASDRVAVDAETPVPPTRAARLAGDFTVRVRFTSKSGYGDYDLSTFGWTFRPRCKQGACDVIWRDLHEAKVRTKLERRGSRYRGSYTGFFGLQCGGANVTSSVSIALRVTSGRVVAGEWVAGRFKGTVEHTEAEQLGCGSSAATLAVNGRLVR